MTRPSHIYIDDAALLHNVEQIRQIAPAKKIIAMVKANAYGCGIQSVLPILDDQVDAFGVACLEEAVTIRKLGSRMPCIVFQGIYSFEELATVDALNLQLVIHHEQQLEWILHHPLQNKLSVWVKVNTGMHRLGFQPHEVEAVMYRLYACPWIDEPIGLMTHFASSDDPLCPSNNAQLARFSQLQFPSIKIKRSMANSGAILALPKTHADYIRPGIMLYGISPFPDKTGQALGLRPAMIFQSRITVIHHYPAHAKIGYGGTWESDEASTIACVPVGYGDGYPRHVHDAKVWINGNLVPIVGRISMDMLTVNLTDFPEVKVGEMVELWGTHLPVEDVAACAGTIPYELICQVTQRVRL